MNNTDVIEFYDGFAEKLRYDKEIGHARYKFIERLAKSGLHLDMSVLDLGCGIGTTTYILGGLAKSVVGIDISNELLNQARQLHSGHNIKYMCADISKLNLERKFHFIGLFDVLEHIKTEQVGHLFNVLKIHLSDAGVIHGVIPYWRYLDNKRVHQPEAMQVVDNSIQIHHLLAWANVVDLEIRSWSVMSLFNDEDYVHFSLTHE